MGEYSTVGKRTPKSDAVPMATGKAKFAADITLEGMLYGKVLYSPYAHARILSIDTSKARRLRGVKAIMTGKDTPRKPYEIGWGPPPEVKDTYILTTDKVRYTGDALAAIAAVDLDTAEEALDLIEVDYEILQVVNNLEEALRPGTIKIHDYAEQNTIRTVTDGYGDVDKGFKESDYIREDVFKFPITSYMMPEPQGCIASFDAVSGRYTFWSGFAWVYMFRSCAAILLDVPYHRIKVITYNSGGSFGGRGSWVYPSHLCAALLSKQSGSPVKIVNSREEDFAHRCATHESSVALKTGVKKDGTLVARDATITYDVGAYSGFEASMGTTPNACWFHAPYRVQNLKASLSTVFTNKPPHGPFRSYGNLQPLAACELQMEMIAKELGLDLMDIRLKNSVLPHTKTPFEWEIQSCGINECIQKAGKAINWEKQGENLAPNRGKGIGTGMFNSVRGGTPDNPLTATVVVNADGTADLIAQGSDSGSGQFFAMRMIVAEELGIPVEDVKKAHVDTDISLDRQGAVFVTISLMGRAPQIAAVD
ncbi:MAG: molybdopterin cofactor-binding domain-containing protein, partial [Thermodesulfobacteriota bacterium]|nr:molybdopterin cofactor-binding domain-containing protein [Thermodesulfobacteriota bacterium]